MNDWDGWGCLEKTRSPKILNACVESAEADVPPADTRRKRGNDLFGGVDGETWSGKDTPFNTSRKDVRRRGFARPIWRVGSGGGLYTLEANELIRNITENREESSRSVPALSFSLLLLFSKLTQSTQLPYSLSFYLQVVVVNKPLGC